MCHEHTNYGWNPVLTQASSCIWIQASDPFEASSSNAPSSPFEYPLPDPDLPPGRFKELPFASDEDNEDPNFRPPDSYTTHTAPDEKALNVPQHMKLHFPQFSFQHLFAATFNHNSSPRLENFASSSLKGDGATQMLDILWDVRGTDQGSLAAWAAQKAGEICASEAITLIT